MKLALAQLNPVVGDIAGNVSRLAQTWASAAHKGVDLLITTELFVTGYPPEDFASKPSLQKLVEDSIDGLARATASGPAILLGAPLAQGGKLYNAALLLDGGKIAGIALKHDLPNYGPFDEKRVYDAAPLGAPLAWRGYQLGVMICEDLWSPDVAAHLKAQGAQILIALNGSPFEAGKQKHRHNIGRERVRETSLPLIYTNQVGGQDELVFEGGSFVMDTSGDLMAQAMFFQEDLLTTAWNMDANSFVPEKSAIAPVPERESALYHALVLATRDYVQKNGFQQVILGLSGGIDSALVAAIATDALGVDKVRMVMMPSEYTSALSIEDATAVARALGRPLASLPITGPVAAFEQALAVQFMGCNTDVTEENIQARCRGTMLMALANKSGSMVLATGNKSEWAVGYATLYGDMCGGFAPLKDVYKTDVYRLAQWRNLNRPQGGLGPAGIIIPDSIMLKAPSAELKPNQKDQDTLPPYDLLDDILTGLIEDDLGVSELSLRGIDALLARRVMMMLDRAEYKRRQGPPGPKVSRRHLTRDRRYPITNRYIGNL